MLVLYVEGIKSTKATCHVELKEHPMSGTLPIKVKVKIKLS
jgi:hypothetical protein